MFVAIYYNDNRKLIPEACGISRWSGTEAEEKTSRLQIWTGWRVLGKWTGQWHRSSQEDSAE